MIIIEKLIFRRLLIIAFLICIFVASPKNKVLAVTSFDPEGVIKIVNEQYIPNTINAFNLRNDTFHADQWINSYAGDPFIEYMIDKYTYSAIPNTIIVPIIKENTWLGLMGLNPDTNFLSWRVDEITNDNNIYKIPTELEINKIFSSNNISDTVDSSTEIKLININNTFYWLIDSLSQITQNTILISAIDKNIYRLHEINLAAENEQNIPTNVSDSLPIVKIKYLDIERDNITNSPGQTNSYLTKLIGKIPYYKQDCSDWCWAGSLTMLHQWWSPIRLGTSNSQQSEIVNYLFGNTNCQQASLQDIYNVVTHWKSVNSTYENFQMNFIGEGKLFAIGNPTGTAEDPKTWLYNVESPVIAAIDTNNDNVMNHFVVIVGYDDNDNGGMVYIHDPWLNYTHYDYAMTYASFNDQWDSVYAGIWPFQKWHGMVAGIPGDNNILYTGNASLHFSGDIQDNQLEQINNIGIGPINDNSSAPTDSFGDSYLNGVMIQLTNSADGYTASPVVLSDFSSYSPYTPDSYIFFKASAIPNGSIYDGASFYVKPNVLGAIQLTYQWWLFDEDDRVHNTATTVTVYDDRNGSNTNFNMWKPFLVQSIHGPYTDDFNVMDDDTTGPTYSNQTSPGNILDSNSSYYRVGINWSDTSSISDVKFAYKFGSNSYSSWLAYSGSSGSSYWYDIPRTTWITHVGETIYWKSSSTDGDSDRPNDTSSTTTGDITGGLISDDDTTGPTFTDFSDSGDAQPSTYYFKVKLTDSSGILDDSSYPKTYYRWNSNAIDESNNDGTLNMDWDGTNYTSSMTIGSDRCGQTIYWRALAYDNDNDRSNDRSSSWSPSTFTGGTLSCPNITISGYVRTSGGTGIQSVTMSGFPTPPSTDASGFYTGTVTYGWSGTITPTKAGYTFSPTSLPYTNVTVNQINQNYIGINKQLTISGYVRTSGGIGIQSVTMSGFRTPPSTDASGFYTGTVYFRLEWDDHANQGWIYLQSYKPHYTSVIYSQIN